MILDKNGNLWDFLKIDIIPDVFLKEYYDMLENMQTSFEGSIYNLNISSGEGVYHPSQNSSSLFCIEKLPPLNGNILDMGCGCGIIGLHLKNQDKTVDLTLTDIDQKALNFAQKNAYINKLEAQIIKSNVFQSLNQNKKFNNIIFNFPLFNKSILNEPVHETHSEISLADFGMLILNEFLNNYKNYLMDNGKCYITISNVSGRDIVEKLQYLPNCKIIALEYKASSKFICALVEISH